MTETFKNVPEFPGYEVGDAGSVWSTKRGQRKSLAAQTTREGYRQVQLWRDGKPKLFSVHTLVLMAFVGPRPARCEGCHDDGDRANNRLGNLSWKTPKGNQADRVRHGTSNRGSRHGSAKLTESDVIALRDGKLGRVRDAAKKLGVSTATVYNAVNGVTWRHMKPAGV